MNLYALLQSRFPADRSAPCLILPGGDDVSYGALEDGVGRLAALLKARGVGVGDRVAAQAAKSPQGLMLYLDTPLRGVWRDKFHPSGAFTREPAPASSFYHIVCAIQSCQGRRR